MNLEKSMAYYDYNYFRQYFYIQDINHKVYLDDPTPKCRFCGQSAPEVSFKKKAHAISEMLGNKSLFSNNECDPCNKYFGLKLEDHLGKYLGLSRTLMGTKGKKGVPSYKSMDKHTRIGVNKNDIIIHEPEGNSNIDIDEAKQVMAFSFQKQPYIPILVLKAFVKMAISMVPYYMLPYFRKTSEWLLEEDYKHSSFNIPNGQIYERFIPGPNPFKELTVIGLIKKMCLQKYHSISL